MAALLTRASIIKPRMSSSTAAPRTVRASGVREAPASLRTRALIPMLVAVIAAATKT